MKIIDPHIHLFDLKKGDYTWLSPQQAPFWSDKHKIHHNFSEADLVLPAPLELSGFVHIEAGFNNQQPWQELAWLEAHCQCPFRSIAFIDITKSPQLFKQDLTQLLTFKSCVGVRYILDGDSQAILAQKNVQQNIAVLAEHKLIFELQMPINNKDLLTAFINIIEKNEQLKVVLEHIGLPSYLNNHQKHQQDWLNGLMALSNYQQVSVKCSGWEMADRQYSFDWAAKNINLALTYFGEDRVMLASNFPLVLFSMSYQTYWKKIIAHLSCSTAILEKITYQNSCHIYKLDIN